MREDERLHLVNADGTVSFFVASGRENDRSLHNNRILGDFDRDVGSISDIDGVFRWTIRLR